MLGKKDWFKKFKFKFNKSYFSVEKFDVAM